MNQIKVNGIWRNLSSQFFRAILCLFSGNMPFANEIVSLQRFLLKLKTRALSQVNNNLPLNALVYFSVSLKN